jgi:uncharacterized protein (TIGR02271 family)
MANETIVAIYDTPGHAQLAAADLKAAGVPDGAISVHTDAPAGSSSTGTVGAPVREQGFWSSLFGGEPDHDTSVYDRSVTSGSTVVTVNAPETHIAEVTQILESHNPIDIDERAASYGLTQTTTMQQPLAASMSGSAATQSTGTGDTIQLAEESLVVGKRLVNRGGTRIRRFVVETPVEEQVSLREEQVVLDRRPVTDGRAMAQDEFGEKTIELTATAEEAVVGKTARVVEEVALRKQAVDRTETIHDTVRKEEVEVEQVPGTATTTTDPMVTPSVPKT